MEVRYLAHVKQMQALELIPGWAAEFRDAFGREAGGLVRAYRTEDAETIVVALGSVLGTVKDTIDEMRAGGARIGVVGIACFRPWPLASVRRALANARRVVVLEKSLAVGVGGIVSTNVRTALTGRAVPVYDVIAGLGGRSITKASLARVFADAIADQLELNTFLDLDRAVVDRVLAREREVRRSGPIAENVLREVGPVAARIG
jgi:pyruvate ferredoxin oxidoreductase alpha subunit